MQKKTLQQNKNRVRKNVYEFLFITKLSFKKLSVEIWNMNLFYMRKVSFA